MPTPLDQNISDKNRLTRLLQGAQPPAPRHALADRATCGERCQDHGDDSGRKARTQIADALADAGKQVSILRRNPAMNAAQIEITAGDMVKQRIARLLDQVEGERLIVANRRAEIAAGFAAALRAPRPEWAAAAPEIRGVVREMTTDEQELFFDSLKGDDALMVQYAVAGVHPALSRVSFGIHKTMRDALIERHDPALLKMPADIDAREAALDVVEDGIRRTAAELVDFDQVGALRALMAEGNP